MTISGQSTDKGREALLAAALLRIGGDTQGPRLFKDAVWPTLRAWADVERSPILLAQKLGWLPETARTAAERAVAEAVKAQDRAKTLGLSLVTVADDEYPGLLAQLPDPPLALWTVGSVSCLAQPAVAIVGSRNASPAGAETARRLARGVDAQDSLRPASSSPAGR